MSDAKRILLCALLILFGKILLPAQVLVDGDILIQPTELLNLSVNSGSEAYIQQVGTGNELELFQQQSGTTGNLARVLQSGDWNIALLTQTESGNKLALIQKGSQNYYELLNSGTGNELATIQQGDGNRVVQQLINSHEITAEFSQVGNFNEITQVLENIQGQNFTVRQIGDGMKVIVRQTSN